VAKSDFWLFCDYTELWEHLELFDEKAAIREYEGGFSRTEAEYLAYFDWRNNVGPGVPAPAEIIEIHRRARRELGWYVSVD
jgi:hypothetical protein